MYRKNGSRASNLFIRILIITCFQTKTYGQFMFFASLKIVNNFNLISKTNITYFILMIKYFNIKYYICDI